MSTPRFDRVAAIVQRLAVLTAAGIAPVSAWRHVAAAVAPQLDRLVADLDSAHDLPDRIAAFARDAPVAERTAWSTLAAVWSIATQAGAGLAPTLERSACVLRGLAESARQVDVALAGPVATSRVVLALPAIGVLLGALLGFDMVGAFVSMPGLICLALGGILITIAVRWNRRLLRWARDLDATPGIGFELFAVALSGGASIDRAAETVASTCAEVGLAPSDAVKPVLQFAAAAGVPVVTLLRAQADEARREARAAAARRASQLETRLLFPLGVCVLPAFVVLGVVPIAIAILSSTALAL